MKMSPHARAIRDVEDEELRSFFFGMSTWQVSVSWLFKSWILNFEVSKSLWFVFFQFILIVAASSIGEELFYRVAVQVWLL